jgi:hypothetical protein
MVNEPDTVYVRSVSPPGVVVLVLVPGLTDILGPSAPGAFK